MLMSPRLTRGPALTAKLTSSVRAAGCSVATGAATVANA